MSTIWSAVAIQKFANWSKVAHILINIGTRILKERLIECIYTEKEKTNRKKMYKSYKDFLSKNMIKILNFHVHKKSLLLNDQNEPFDSPDRLDIQIISDLFLLLNNLDSQLNDNLKRIYKIRCNGFAHIPKAEIDDIELGRYESVKNNKTISYEQYPLLAKIECALYSICLNDNQIMKIKSEIDETIAYPVSHEMDKINLALANIIANDKQNFNLYCDKLKEICEKNEIQIQHIRDKNQSLFLIEKEIVNVLNSLHGKNVNVFNLLDSLSNSVQTAVNNVNENINKGVEEVKLSLKATEANIIDQINKPSTMNYRESSISELKDYFDAEYESSYFKILILDARSYEYKEVAKEKLAELVAFTKWNMVLDLEPESKTSLSKKVMELYKKDKENNINQGTYFNVLLSNMSSINRWEQSNIFKAGTTCYVINDSKNEDDLFAQFEQVKELFRYNLKSKNNIVNGLCVNLLLNPQITSSDYVRGIRDLNEEIYRAFKDSALKENEFFSFHLHFSDIYLNLVQVLKNYQDNVFTPKSRAVSKLNFYLIQCKLESLAYLNARRQVEAGDFVLPGKDGDVHWTANDHNNYINYFEVYHKSIGKLPNNDVQTLYKLFEEKKILFLMGAEIDPELMYVNDNIVQSYVNTDFMQKTFESIKKRTTKSDHFYKSNQRPITEIYHGPSTGGSTIGQVLLYKMRADCPCIKLKWLDAGEGSRCIEGIKTIASRTELPVIILIDVDTKLGNETFTIDAVHTLSTTLSRDENSRCYIVFIKRTSEFSNIDELTDRDVACYKVLYEKYINKRADATKILDVYRDFLTIRWCFLKNDYQSLQELDKIAHNYLESVRALPDKLQMARIVDLFLFVYVTDKFSGGTCLSNKIVAHMLEKKPIEVIKESKNKDNKMFHLLTFVKSDNGFKFINFDFGTKFVEMLVRKLHACDNMKETRTKTVELFFDKYLAYLRSSTSDVMTHFSSLTKLLFLKREEISNRVLDGSGGARSRVQARTLSSTSESSSTADGMSDGEDDFNNDYEDDYDDESDNDNRHDSVKNHYSELIIEAIKYLGENQVSAVLKELWEIFKKTNDEMAPYLGTLYAKFVYYNRDKDEGLQIMKDILNINAKLKSALYKCPKESNISELFTSYGYLVKNYVTYCLMKKRIDSKNAIKYDLEVTNDDVKENILSTVEESIEAFQIAIRLEDDNHAALIGDSMVRRELLEFYFNLSGKNNAERKKNFTKYLQKPNCHNLLCESEERICANFKRLDHICLYKDIKRNYNKLYMQNYFHILDFKENVSSDIVEQSLSLKCPIDLYIVIKFKKQKSEKRDSALSWTDLSIAELNDIIRYNEKKLEDEKFCNFLYKNLVLAYIHKGIKLSKSINQNSNDLKKAEAICEQWFKKMDAGMKKGKAQLDTDAYYYYYIFQLLLGIQSKDADMRKDYITKALTYKLKCKELYKNKAPRNIKKLEFQIGVGQGLSGLLEFSPENDTQQLKPFIGEVVEDEAHHLCVFLEEVIKVFLSPKKNEGDPEIKRAELRQRHKYKYHICISRANLYMFKYRQIF